MISCHRLDLGWDVIISSSNLEILVFLVVNLVLVSMFRVCCETGPIFVCAFTKKIPQQDGLETIPVGGILILKKFTLMNYLAKSNHIICFCNYQDPYSGSRDKH